jgi:flagellar operon protein
MNAVQLQQLNKLQKPVHGNVPNVNQGQSSTNFQEILQKSLDNQPGVKFSAHAVDRLHERNIALSNDDISRLNNAVSLAEGKGSRESLVLMNDLAFVVSVKNKTVVTAMANSQLKDNVITNIDSTVIL